MAEPIEPPGACTVVPDAAQPKPDKAQTKPDGPKGAKGSNRPTGPKRQKYALPLPVRTFPLPAFYPSNPLSLVHLAWAWASQVLGPPALLPVPVQKVHKGVWNPATRSVRVTDPASMNDLWCQGFFGKGSLSRSEPSWLMRERERATSEQRTNLRREERAESKWERGRAALEAIEKKRKQEEAAAAQAANAEAAKPAVAPASHCCYTFQAPVGPLELLALPNSAADLAAREKAAAVHDNVQNNANGNGSAHVHGTAKPMAVPDVSDKPQKSVRFSPTVESTTFAKSDPPRSGANQGVLVNKEHLQLAPEEAFFLAYAVGALRVVDEAGRALSVQKLFRLFSEHASFPPSDSPASRNRFVTHYSVYHHFRSLGWTPRHGIKFGVDWLLYGKGPALDHAEFGVMVMADGGTATRKSWHWLHSVNRVLSTVYKSMVLVYVDTSDVPADDADISSLLRAVKIRSVMVRRWSSNRNRD